MTTTHPRTSVAPTRLAARLLSGVVGAWRRGVDALGHGEARFWGTELGGPR